MKLPEKIYLEIKSKKETELEDLIVQLNVRSGRKNPYHIFLPKTDKDGRAIISKDDFKGQFEDHYGTGLMDYDGSIETAKPEVEVSLFDPAWMIENKKLALAWPLLKNEKPKWKSRQEKYNYMISCRNPKFRMKQFLFNIEKLNCISVNIEIK